jgi:hypothetical protein
LNPALEARVRDEVEALHRFFVGWFSGALAPDIFEAEFLARFDLDFVLIPPGGVFLSLDDFRASLRQAHASNPNFRIAIRNVKLQRTLDDHVVATYEEWQRNAIASTPADNGRIATVIFEKPSLKWLHVHETWLPESITMEGPYDF